MAIRPIRVLAIIFTLSLIQLALPATQILEAQAPQAIRAHLPNGEITPLPVESHRGYPVIPASQMEPLGWSLQFADALAGAIRGFFKRYPAGGP